MKIKNLSETSEEEQQRFVKSFDYVLSDLDGVIWLRHKVLPGVVDCVNNLRKLGKSIAYVTNNGAITTEGISKRLQDNNMSVIADDIVNPPTAYISVLKKEHFNKTIFLIGSDELKQQLETEGFKIAPDPPYPIKDEFPVIEENLADDIEIGAVLLDYDINLSMLKLMKALIYLRRSECLFIIGNVDKSIIIPPFGPMLGNHYFYESLKHLSGRSAYQMSKPSLDFCEFVKKKFLITNPKRVLFIGDTIKEDMGFATNSGYQKLLVLTGVAQKGDIDDWKQDENCKPDYYIDSMDAFNSIIEKCLPE